MAVKKYAYYNKGNKLAIIEENTSNLSSADYGRYESPKETVEDGLELEYTYMPDYTINQLEISSEKSIGWSVDINGKIVLHFYYSTESTPTADFGSNSGPRDFSGAGINLSAGDTIVIKDGTWAGKHKISYIVNGKIGLTTSFFNTNPSLKLETPYNELRSITVDFTNYTSIDIASGDDTAEKKLINSYLSRYPGFVENDLWDATNVYIAIYNASVAANNGIYSLSNYRSDSGHADYGKFFCNKRYFFSTDVREYKNVNIEGSSAPAINADLTNDADDSIDIHFIKYEQSTIYYDLNLMEDETFDIDLNRYQSNAVVYYLKAKNAEDMGDMDKREYFMRLFKKQVEKFSSKRKKGPNIMQGHWSMSKIF